jgi:cell division protein FtsB
MPARSSTGVGAGVAIALLSILTLALFILSVVFYGKYKDANEQYLQVEQEYTQTLGPGERSGERIQRLRDRARDKRRSTLVGYLAQELEDTMTLVSGNPDLSSDDLQASLNQNFEEIGDAKIFDFMRAQKRQLAEANQQIQDLDATIADLEGQMEDSDDRFAELHDRREADTSAVRGLVAGYGDTVDRYDEQLRGAIADMDDRVEEILEAKESELAALQSDLDSLEEENLVLRGQIAKYNKEASDTLIRGRDEYALVDATVLSTNAADQTIILDRGRRNNIVLGMSFEIYSDASVILDKDTGDMLRGKATAEVISVEEQTAVARLIRQSVANPVLDGDVLANPAYDPNKRYHFLVYGEFDTNFDARTTSREADDVSALIEQWGGIIVNSIEENVDFLVLGAKPYVGPPPAPDAPLAIILRWQEDKKKADRYDDLFNTAASTSIPILNQNRLFTLTGYFER